LLKLLEELTSRSPHLSLDLLVRLLLRLWLRVLLGELHVHHGPRHLVVLRRGRVVVLVALRGAG
jgi:hypothetical protein